MPFESKAQQRFMFAAESRGEVPKGTARRWAKHTPNMKTLPETKEVEPTKKTAAVRAIVGRLIKSGTGALPGAPMQPLQASQPANPITPQPNPNAPRASEQIAKEISAVPPENRTHAAYARLARFRTGALRGYAAASHPDAKKNFSTAFNGGGGGEKVASLKELKPAVQGVLMGCAASGLNDAQTTVVFQKAAERRDSIGADVREFLKAGL